MLVLALIWVLEFNNFKNLWYIKCNLVCYLMRSYEYNYLDFIKCILAIASQIK